MSISHKAYAFDWRRFEADDLYEILQSALKSGDPAAVAEYVEAHRDEIKDPYEGLPIPPDWQATLSNRDVHEYGDFALTRFYDPADYQGIADSWSGLDLPEEDMEALLGFPFGEPGREFDPGRLGAYFQTPEQVVGSLRRVERFGRGDVFESYAQLLRTCAKNGLGVYVTF